MDLTDEEIELAISSVSDMFFKLSPVVKEAVCLSFRLGYEMGKEDGSFEASL